MYIYIHVKRRRNAFCETTPPDRPEAVARNKWRAIKRDVLIVFVYLRGDAFEIVLGSVTENRAISLGRFSTLVRRRIRSFFYDFHILIGRFAGNIGSEATVSDVYLK